MELNTAIEVIKTLKGEISELSAEEKRLHKAIMVSKCCMLSSCDVTISDTMLGWRTHYPRTSKRLRATYEWKRYHGFSTGQKKRRTCFAVWESSNTRSHIAERLRNAL